MKKVTILDIAAKMSLSRNTVAKALSGGHVSLETRMEVVDTAYKMGYSKLDSKLLTELANYKNEKCKGNILVIYKKWEAVRLNRILNGVSDKAREEGFKVQIAIVESMNPDIEFVERQMDGDTVGIVFLGVFTTAFIKKICNGTIPVTFYNTPVNAQEYIEIGDVYSLESFYSMNKITSYCIDRRQCKSFMFIGDAEGSRGVQARMLGFLSACNSHGIRVNDNDLYTRPEKESYFDYNEVAGILGKLLRLPDAIICENDDVAQNVALWAYKNSAQNGMNTVITGFENTITNDFIRQDILTVEVRMEELGKRLVASIVDRIKNPKQDISFVTVATYPKII